MGGGNVIVLSGNSDWDAQLAKAAGKKIVIDFTATWCGPCKMIAPFFEELSTKYTNVVFLKVDVDSCDAVAKDCGISAMPTFQVWDADAKTKLEELVGADKAKLEELIKKFN